MCQRDQTHFLFHRTQLLPVLKQTEVLNAYLFGKLLEMSFPWAMLSRQISFSFVELVYMYRGNLKDSCSTNVRGNVIRLPQITIRAHAISSGGHEMRHVMNCWHSCQNKPIRGYNSSCYTKRVVKQNLTGSLLSLTSVPLFCFFVCLFCHSAISKPRTVLQNVVQSPIFRLGVLWHCWHGYLTLLLPARHNRMQKVPQKQSRQNKAK